MKVTDFSIIFALTAICFFRVMDISGDVAYERIYLNGRYNVIMDNAVEDALRAAYENVDSKGRPLVNLNTASEYFLDEVAVMLDGNKYLKDYYYNRFPVLIYICSDGFYCYGSAAGADNCSNNKRELIYSTKAADYVGRQDGTGEWSGIHYYAYKDKTEHSDKIVRLLAFIRDNYGIELSVPYNDGESYENTIGDYSLLAVYWGYDGMYCFSAACLKEFQAFS